MKEFIVIGGMHRSGTSLISSYLEQSGLDLGDKLFPPDKGNPRGYFEDMDMVHFHNRVQFDLHRRPSPQPGEAEHQQCQQQKNHNIHGQ